MPSLPSRSDNINGEKGAPKERKGRFNFARDDKLRPSLFGGGCAFLSGICALGDEVELRVGKLDGSTSHRAASLLTALTHQH